MRTEREREHVRNRPSRPEGHMELRRQQHEGILGRSSAKSSPHPSRQEDESESRHESEDQSNWDTESQVGAISSDAEQTEPDTPVIWACNLVLIQPKLAAACNAGLERAASATGGTNDRGTAPANSTWSYCACTVVSYVHMPVQDCLGARTHLLEGERVGSSYDNIARRVQRKALLDLGSRHEHDMRSVGEHHQSLLPPR